MSKVTEAQDILDSAVEYLNDMLAYCADSADEYASAKAHVATLMSKM